MDAYDEGYAAGLFDAETISDQGRDDLARKLQYAEAEIERLTAEVERLRSMLDGLPALVEAVPVAEYPVPNNTGRTVYVGQLASVFVQNPAGAQGYDMSAIEYAGRRMGLVTARHVAAELLRAGEEYKRLKAEYEAGLKERQG
jgi:hypothetical protein